MIDDVLKLGSRILPLPIWSKDGAYPAGALVLDANGDLYGTTQEGGSSNLGTVYKLEPN
jgi:uncharacterized repeat protein (TIGR03803 family)